MFRASMLLSVHIVRKWGKKRKAKEKSGTEERTKKNSRQNEILCHDFFFISFVPYGFDFIAFLITSFIKLCLPFERANTSRILIAFYIVFVLVRSVFVPWIIIIMIVVLAVLSLYAYGHAQHAVHTAHCTEHRDIFMNCLCN